MAGKPQTRAKVQNVLDLVGEGMSVMQACARAGLARSVFLKYVSRDEYARARDAQADAHFDEMADLEEQCRAGILDPQAFRALLDSRKWRLARMRPKIYGDKSAVDLTSSDGSMTQAPAVVIDFSGMSPEDIAAAARAAFKGE